MPHRRDFGVNHHFAYIHLFLRHYKYWVKKIIIAIYSNKYLTAYAYFKVMDCFRYIILIEVKHPE